MTKKRLMAVKVLLNALDDFFSSGMCVLLYASFFLHVCVCVCPWQMRFKVYLLWS
jgi:hypothetical protein